MQSSVRKEMGSWYTYVSGVSNILMVIIMSVLNTHLPESVIKHIRRVGRGGMCVDTYGAG